MYLSELVRSFQLYRLEWKKLHKEVKLNSVLMLVVQLLILTNVNTTTFYGNTKYKTKTQKALSLKELYSSWSFPRC